MPEHKPGRGRIYEDITKTIGDTPLVRMKKFAKGHDCDVDLLGKLEFFNPLASVKDRIGLSMIEAMDKAGKLKPGSVIVEATSGNTGIALAFVAAQKGYRCILVMPETMSVERRKMLAILGAELVLTPGPEGIRGAFAKADEILKSTPNAVMPQQFENPANPEIHRRTTAEEILNDTGGVLDIFVSGIGTGGTITGAGRALKQHLPNLQIIAVEPTDSAVLSGGQPGPHKIQGIGAGIIPEILDTKIYDEVVTISNDDALAYARECAKLEGIPIGISSGAALAAAIRVGKRPENKGKRIVVIIPSFAERYLSTPLFEGL